MRANTASLLHCLNSSQLYEDLALRFCGRRQAPSVLDFRPYVHHCGTLSAQGASGIHRNSTHSKMQKKSYLLTAWVKHGRTPRAWAAHDSGEESIPVFAATPSESQAGLDTQTTSSSHRTYIETSTVLMSALLSWRNTQCHHLVIYIILIVIVSYNG